MKQTQSLASNNKKKRRILMGTLIPLTVIGVALGVALPITMCHEQTSIKIEYIDAHNAVQVEIGKSETRNFAVVDNHDNSITDAIITYVTHKTLTFTFTTNQTWAAYQFECSNTASATVDQYPITITATTPNGLTASLDITIDIVPAQATSWTITTADFGKYVNGSGSSITGPIQPAFNDYLDQHNVSSIVFDNLSIGNNAFRNCAGLDDASKQLPIEFKGLGTPSIGSNAFENCVSISQIICSTPTISIGDSAFYHCENLSQIISSSTVGPTTISIGRTAFLGCVGLTGFSREDSQVGAFNISSIGSFAFFGCANLEYDEISNAAITLPTGDTWTGNSSTKSGYWLKSGANELYSGGCLAVGAIQCPFISIGSNAFAGCASLTQISDLPGGAVGDFAFDGCASLVTVSFKTGATKTTFIDSYAFQNCVVLNSIQLSTGWTTSTIASDAFDGCADGGTISGTDKDAFLAACQARGLGSGWTAP